MIELLFLFIGLVLGFVTAYFYLKTKASHPPDFLNEKELWLNEKGSLEQEKSVWEERATSAIEQLNALRNEVKDKQDKVEILMQDLATEKSNFLNVSEKLETQKKELETLEKRFTVEFRNIANELLEDKSKKFTEQNQKNISDILKPLDEKIKLFQEKVEQTHKENLEKNAGLVQQILSLKDLNLQMSKEAQNLTKALKGDSKMQGNWGEVILERVLEKSGLIKGREYFVQVPITDAEGKRKQPDVIIQLPENKNVIIDAKVSLVDYERYVNADTESDKAMFLKQHIQSLKSHVKGLSDKQYQKSSELDSPDFVLLFVPIEPAFILAVQHDAELFNDAFSKNIVIVSTSTLLATLRTIASIWRQENQNKNALEIAAQAGDMYDKFTAFTEDLIKVGNQIDTTKSTYIDAMKKLSEGKGNLVNRAEKLKLLGAKTSKALSKSLIERSQPQQDLEA